MSKANVQRSSASGISGGKLPEFLLNLKPNSHLLHLTVLRQLSNQRAGTASTKTRAEVRGGGKKPWKQKGTGRARVGSIRSPLWVGGGITFGPKPRSYKINLPQKARQAAITQALAARANETTILKGLVDNKDSKTKEFMKWLKSINLIKKPVLIIASPEEKFYKEAQIASRNITGVMVCDCNFIGVYELLKAKTLAITETAFQNFENKFSKKQKEIK